MLIANRPTLLLLATLAALVLAAGCGEEAPSADPGSDEPDESESDDPDSDEPESDDGSDDPDDGADDPDEGAEDEDSPLGVATEQALRDAADRAGVDPEDVEVIEAEEVTWSDGAIGCPEPGNTYTQALVEGYRIVVEVDGERMHYHAAEGEEASYCADPQEPGERS